MLAGYRKLILVGLVLGALGLGYLTIQWLQDTGKQELKLELLEQDLNTRERIDNAVRNSPTGRDDALGVLREFNSNN